MSTDELLKTLIEKVDFLIEENKNRKAEEKPVTQTPFTKSVSIAAATKVLGGVSKKTVYAYINKGMLQTVKLSPRKTYITVKSLDKLLTPKA